MKHYLAALFVAVQTATLSTSVMSAAGVVEAQPYLPGQPPQGGQPGSTSSNDALVMLLDQFREMRAELETLRGLVEEQGYDLRNLQRESLDRYTDLDARLGALSSATPSPSSSPVGVSALPGAGGAQQPTGSRPVAAIAPGAPATASTASQQAAFQPASTLPSRVPSSLTTPVSAINAAAVPIAAEPAVIAPVVSTAVAVNNTPAIPTLQPTVLTEQQQYQVALDSLLQEEQYQRSVAEFDQYLSMYPNGRFITNAYYWKGQAYLNLAMLNEARDAFEVIVNQYPDGRKVDDAMYSLGTVYDKLGDTDKARQLLRQVQSRYPNTSAANLADIYLRSMN
ncbi:MAG: tol-pal system protein YbgF [Gammaproteobacteria bacterium]|nr:tol-pal system protein YbgF [Gammaproteobacteria bacterium]